MVAAPNDGWSFNFMSVLAAIGLCLFLFHQAAKGQVDALDMV
jgi:hypothetical protein